MKKKKKTKKMKKREIKKEREKRREKKERVRESQRSSHKPSFAAWLYPALLSLTLAKPWHNSHPLPALHSFAPAAPAHKGRGMLLFLSRPLLLHFDWHLLACTKRRHTLCLQFYSIVPIEHASKEHGPPHEA
jgi:hypothetical protein